MKLFTAFYISTFWYFGNTGAECENGWEGYQDELCIKAFTDNLLTFDEAKTFCWSQGTDSGRAKLVMVKNSDMQNLLSNYTHNNFDSLWLGSQYNAESAQFLWEDGEPLTYTNWAEGYPRNMSNAVACISLRPADAKPSSKISEGLWEDVECQRRNVALCQRTMPWSFRDAVAEIFKLRRQNLELRGELDTVRAELLDELQTVDSRVIPVGSIYIEHFNQPSPLTLWPSLLWQDITGTYAGLFFRAQGGGSDAWGVTQNECAPRIIQASAGWTFGNYLETIDISGNGWSEYVWSAHMYPFDKNGQIGVRFNSKSCEVRPKNQAIRVWKRIA